MSVCLGVIKSIAVSSLGLYAGTLVTGTLVSYVTPLEVISQHLKPVVCKLGEFASVLATLSTGFFSLSYFGAPPQLRHPYLLYGALVAPVSGLYLWAISRCNHKCSSSRKNHCPVGRANHADPAPPLNDSVVDLGPVPETDGDAKCPFGSAAATNGTAAQDAHRPQACQSKIVTHLTLISVATVAGFVASVVGVYGEGQFA